MAEKSQESKVYKKEEEIAQLEKQVEKAEDKKEKQLENKANFPGISVKFVEKRKDSDVKNKQNVTTSEKEKNETKIQEEENQKKEKETAELVETIVNKTAEIIVEKVEQLTEVLKKTIEGNKEGPVKNLNSTVKPNIETTVMTNVTTTRKQSTIFKTISQTTKTSPMASEYTTKSDKDIATSIMTTYTTVVFNPMIFVGPENKEAATEANSLNLYVIAKNNSHEIDLSYTVNKVNGTNNIGPKHMVLEHGKNIEVDIEKNKSSLKSEVVVESPSQDVVIKTDLKNEKNGTAPTLNESILIAGLVDGVGRASPENFQIWKENSTSLDGYNNLQDRDRELPAESSAQNHQQQSHGSKTGFTGSAGWVFLGIFVCLLAVMVISLVVVFARRRHDRNKDRVIVPKKSSDQTPLTTRLRPQTKHVGYHFSDGYVDDMSRMPEAEMSDDEVVARMTQSLSP